MKLNTDFNKLKLLLDTLYFPLSGGRVNGKTIFSKQVQFASADKKKKVSIQNGMIEGANVTYFGICDAEQGSKQFKSVKIQGVEEFSLRAGTSIGVKFATNNLFPATSEMPIALNVNNTGVKNIYYDVGIPVGTDIIAFGKANTTNFYMFDGTYWVFVGSGENASANIRSLMLEMCYPVGSIYMSTKNVSPQTFLGGTWKSKSGYMLRGATSNVTFDSDTNDGGADSVTVSSVASHNHTQNSHTHAFGAKGDGSIVSGNMNFSSDRLITTWSIGRTDSGGHTYGRNGTGGGTTNYTTPTNVANGAAYSVATLPKYKNIYIWERIS